MAFVAGNGFMGSKVRAQKSSTCALKMTLTRTDTAVTVVENGRAKEIPANTEVDLRKNMIENKVDVYTLGGKLRNCGGNGACGLCRVRVVNGFQNVNPRTPREDAVLRKQGAADDVRLACRTQISGPVTIETKPN